MGNSDIKIGDIFGSWEVVDLPYNIKQSSGKWRSYILVKCICGTIKKQVTYNIKSGKSSSCGCINKSKYTSDEQRLRNIYRSMINRCYTEGRKDAQYYYDKGITVCDLWLESQDEFIRWGIAQGYTKGLEIDRVDHLKGYSPENCRLADRNLNNFNKGIRTNNSSGVTGVKYCSRDDLWYATLSFRDYHNKKGFKTKQQAIECRKSFEEDIRGLYNI